MKATAGCVATYPKRVERDEVGAATPVVIGSTIAADAHGTPPTHNGTLDRDNDGIACEKR